jgi:hypothetical protein
MGLLSQDDLSVLPRVDLEPPGKAPLPERTVN